MAQFPVTVRCGSTWMAGTSPAPLGSVPVRPHRWVELLEAGITKLELRWPMVSDWLRSRSMEFVSGESPPVRSKICSLPNAVS